MMPGMISKITKMPGKIIKLPDEAEANKPPIDIPNEMDFPMPEEYFLNHITENYTQWYKRKNREFCDMMKKTIEAIEDYLEEYKD